MFLDASAAIAILAHESDGVELSQKLEGVEGVLFSALAHYETCVGYARSKGVGPVEAEDVVLKFLKGIRAHFVPLDERIGRVAMQAHARFGKGRHRAALNMGDCFAYACAKAHDVPLLCKGDNFIHTDIELA